MRKLGILVVLAAAVQLSLDHLPLDRFHETETERDARLVATLRCGELAGPEQRSCEAELEARFAAGAIEPARVLRSDCTRFVGTWSRLPDPPAICVERFGGWLVAGSAGEQPSVSSGPPRG